MSQIRNVAILVAISFTGLFSQQVFEVNLNDRTGDSFKVSLAPEHLSASNDIYQFASTAPGTYQVMDIGRFVNDFKAFDKSGNIVPTEHVSINQWKLSHPSDVKKITYTVADMWNAKVDRDRIYPMCSTTVTDDFVMLNGQGVFGYFNDMQTEPIKIKIDYPSDWQIGTALKEEKDGYYVAEDFDKVVDSPFYLGKLSVASTEVGGAKIDVFTYSKSGLITSEALLTSLKSILKAESDFTRGLPVDRYTFLFWFGNFTAGAWEHSYSSEYVMKEDTLAATYAANIISIVAHEFFHVNTPLHIHSELVEHFNFVKPAMSQHLWLYEGTTEWAAHMLQLRDTLISLDEYLQTLRGELNANDGYDQNLSLTELGVHCTEMQSQYPNIYQKGALVSGLLDIRLLELSHGRQGLRELIIKLSKEFGTKRAFSEDKFFDQLVALTYPEIGDFFARYIKGSEKLPMKEYFGLLGIDYSEKGDIDSSKSGLGIGLGLVDNAIGVTTVYPDSKSGLVKGDIVQKIDSTELTFQNAQLLFGKLTAMKSGTKVSIQIKRGSAEMEVLAELQPRVLRHKFSLNPNASPEQLHLREAWMKNL